MSHSMEDSTVARWKRLGDMLLEGGLITRGQLEEGLAEKDRQKCFLGQALVRLGYLSQDELISFLVKQCKIPHINLVDYSIDPRIVRLLPNELCLKYKLLAIDNLGTILTVAMVNPLDLDALEQARAACPDLKLKPILCTPEHFDLVARRLLISEEDGKSVAPKSYSLASFGLAPARAAAKPGPVAASAPEKPQPPAGLPWVRDDFNLLVRDMLGELLSIFQGPISGGTDGASSPMAGAFSQQLEFSFTLSVTGEVCYVSPGITTVLGYKPVHFQQAFLTLLTDHPGNSVLRRAIILSRSGQHPHPVEAEFRAVDGTPKMLLVALIPVFDANQSLAAIQAVARDISRREQTEQHVFLAATHDPLTGLHNRRSFMARLDEALCLAARHKTPTSLGLVNLDNFTELNQELGHAEGDRILICIGKLLRETLRGEDIIARSGGDEFCVLMPHVAPDAGRNGLERCHTALGDIQFTTSDGRATRLTVTSALVPIGSDDRTASTLLERARALVMQGKAEGGNRVVTGTPAD